MLNKILYLLSLQADFLPTNYQVLTSLLFSISILIVILSVLKLKKAYSFFSDRNVNGPKPWPFLGHLHILIWNDMATETTKLARTFGPLYGLYFGLEPRLMIAERELAQQICIKDFEAFTDHHGMELVTEYQKNFLFSQRGDTWRRNRIFISPTFTSGKIRKMYKLLDICAKDLIQLLAEQLQKQNQERNSEEATIINAKDIFNMYTLDAIARCCYGLNLERAKGIYDKGENSRRNDFVLMCKELFNTNLIRILPEVLLPLSLLRAVGYSVTPLSTLEPVAQVVRKMLESRKKASQKNQKFDDYLQLLVDARIDDNLELDELDLAENHHANLTHESLRNDQKSLVDKLAAQKEDTNLNCLAKQTNTSQDLRRAELSDIEVISNAMLLLFVGLETTASLLSSCVYSLAFHQEIQQKLQKEVAKIADRDQNGELSFDYDKLTTCKYLDAVISETLRLVPVAPMVDRKANREYKFQKYNFSIPKDTVLFIAIHAIHLNPDYWPEPERFDPERFMPGNKEKILAGSYLPFGQGPRHCVGMRFSLTETKLALARVVMDYQFDPVPGLKFPGARPVGFTPGGLRDPRVILRQR